MIIRPEEMNFSNKKFSMIIYAAPGTGKTTVACSAPKPFLIDLDKGISRVKAQHRCIASMINKYEDLEEDFKSPEFKECETVIIDTGGALITYLQEYVMRKDVANKTKSGTISIKGFGAVKSEFVALTNKLKTLYDKNIIYVFHSQEEKDKDGQPIQRLLCEGSARNIVWQPCDFGGYMSMKDNKRVISFTPTDEYFAKGCYGISGTMEIPTLTDTFKNNFLTRLFETARNNIANESKYFEAEKQAYEDVMKQGEELVAEIKDIAGVNEFGTKFKALNHHLTSEVEIKNMFREKLETLNIYYDKDQKAYIQKVEK